MCMPDRRAEMDLLKPLLFLIANFPFGAFMNIPQFSSICGRTLGDINLAVMIDLAVPHSETLCLNHVKNGYWPFYVVQLEAFAHKLREINQRQDILPNITIGFVALDTCFSTLAAVAQFTNLITDPTIVDNNKTSESVPCEQLSLTSDRIVGVFGPSTSDQGIQIASHAGVFKLPVLSSLASTYELSDKGRFRYFSRLLSPNPVQVEATLDFLKLHKWTYVSFVYLEGSYGEGAAKTMLRSSRARGVCLAVYEMYPSYATDTDVQEIARKLASHPSARVVVLYIYLDHIENLFAALKAYPDFSPIWFGSSAVSSQSLGPDWNGAFTINAMLSPAPDFEQYMKNLTPSADGRGNRWLPQLWEQLLSCSWNPQDNQTTDCSSYENTTVPSVPYSPYSGKYTEGAQTFAFALDALIKESCPEVYGGTNSTSDIYGCVRDHGLLDFLRAVDFQGVNGPLAFDENGDRYSDSSINQYVYDNGIGVYTIIGDYNARNASLKVQSDKLNWTVYDSIGAFDVVNDPIPESVCSKPCQAKEYAVLTDELCCWECRRCRTNEKLNENKTDCESCPALTWPDAETSTSCDSIPETYTDVSDPLGTTLLVIGVIGIILGLVTTAWYIKHRKDRLIKASSRELSGFILFGVVLAYVSALLFLVRPSSVVCHLRMSGFQVSVSLIFGPLFVKTNRIYRIFSAGKRGTKSPTFIGNTIQVLFAVVLLLIQIFITIVTEVTIQSKPVLRMPVPSEPFVELSCSVPLGVFLPGLIFNLLMIIMCAVFGYLTRKLPANFNESWYIFVSVATTLFLWMVFIPAYLTAFYASNQVVLLCCCLFFNATVTLICLFWPKIYALVAKAENDLNVTNTSATGSTVVAK